MTLTARRCPAAVVLLLHALACSPPRVACRGEAMNDGLFLVFIDEGQLQTDSGAPATYDAPDLFISMPHVLLDGRALAGAPPGAMDERACAAACRATPGCNVYQWCPIETGCSISLTEASQASAPGGSLAYRQCGLMQQPNALAVQAHPPEASLKGDTVSVTSGQIVQDTDPKQIAGYTLHVCLGWYNMYDYTCEGTLKPNVCMRQGGLEEAVQQCDAEGPKCMGIKWFPLGRDFINSSVFMLKGVPDTPTTTNFPGVPIDLSLANWNGAVMYYAKDMSDAELAAARAYLPAQQGGLSSGAIAGIATGAAVAALAALGALWVLLCKKRRKHVADAAALKMLEKVISQHSGGLVVDGSGSLLTASKDSSKLATPSPSLGSNGTTSGARTSVEMLAAELLEWLVDVSQLKFVMGPDSLPVKLGAGAQGVVYKALLNGVQPVAAKVLSMCEIVGSQASFLHEARMLHALRHRNMVHLVGVALHGDKALVLTEYMEGRDLFAMLNVKEKSGDRLFSWYKRGKRVALDVASALAFLHGKHVMHFDIKSSNVLMTRDLTAKLGDVGLSKALSHTFASMAGGAIGTFAWCAPEVLMSKPCSFPADVYSFGVLLLEICTGELPLRGRLQLPAVPAQCPQEVADLALRCMQDDPAQRPTAHQLVEELSVLAGVALGGRNGLMSGADGLEQLDSGPDSSGNSSGMELADKSAEEAARQLGTPAADGRMLKRVVAPAGRAVQASPFA